jgi:hypothetical protein
MTLYNPHRRRSKFGQSAGNPFPDSGAFSVALYMIAFSTVKHTIAISGSVTANG